jgi:RNA polymerase sigma-70 factor (ECF subfamily)
MMGLVAMPPASSPGSSPAGSPPDPLPLRAEIDRPTLARCRAGDPVAFRAFVIRYQRPVFACLSRILGRGSHVDDLAQEVFLRAFRAFPAFDLDAVAKPSSWLLTIATRIALDARKRRAVPIRPLEEASLVSQAGTPETERIGAELARLIDRAAAELPDDQRAAFVLAEYHGFTTTEIAAAMGVPEATAKTRLFRARERMRASLGDEWRQR